MRDIVKEAIVRAVDEIGSGEIKLLDLIKMYVSGQIHPSRILYYDHDGGTLYLPKDRSRWPLSFDDEDPDDNDTVTVFRFSRAEDELGGMLRSIGIPAQHC